MLGATIFGAEVFGSGPPVVVAIAPAIYRMVGPVRSLQRPVAVTSLHGAIAVARLRRTVTVTNLARPVVLTREVASDG